MLIIVNAVRLVKASAERLLGKNDVALNETAEETLLSCGFTGAEVRSYASGGAVTLAAVVTGEGDEAAARRLIQEKTGADLFLSRR